MSGQFSHQNREGGGILRHRTQLLDNKVCFFASEVRRNTAVRIARVDAPTDRMLLRLERYFWWNDFRSKTDV